jgi:hypothetical protein
MYIDTSAKKHQEVIVQTQTGGSDPVTVNAANPMPVSSSGGIASGAADSGNPVKVGAVYNSAPPTFASGNRSDLQADVNGFLKVNIAAGAAAGGTSSNFNSAFPTPGTAVGASDGSNMKPLLLDGSGNLKVNIAAGGVAAGTDNSAFTAGVGTGLPIMAVYNDAISNAVSGDIAVPRMNVNRALLVAPQGTTSGGWTPYQLISAATTNATSVKGSAGNIGSIICGNTGSVAFLKLYNKATAPSVGSDTPVHTICIPGNAAGAGFSYPIPSGLSFSTGIALAITGSAAVADTTAVSLSQVTVNIGYL